MKAKDGKLIDDVTLSAGWAMKSQMQSWFYLDSNNTYDTKGQRVKEFYFNKNGVLTYIKEKSVINPPTVLRNIANTKTGSSELTSIIGPNKFDFPKPSELIKFLLKLVVSNNDIVLDSFAGTGTTAHSVCKLNKEKNLNLNFILIELEDYANDVTAERVKRVSMGYEKGSKKVKGLGGAFDFYELGLPLFDENLNLNEEVGLFKIREYIWFSETRSSYTELNTDTYLLGQKDETAYYFIYEKDQLTTLDYDALELIKSESEQYIIYADNCLLPKEFMAKKSIIFKKIPRDITRF